MKLFDQMHWRPTRAIPITIDDRRTGEVVPYGRNGAGLWTSHPIGFVIVAGILTVGFVGLPEWRSLFLASGVLGVLTGLFLWRYHSRA